MKIYIISPWFKTGGTESLHQLCQIARDRGYQSYMFYIDAPNDTDVLFSEDYPSIERVSIMEDKTGNVLVYPEIYSPTMFNIYFIQQIMWWLSYDKGLHNLEILDKYPNLKHAFQSQYAKYFVTSTGKLTNKQVFDLTDYVKIERYYVVPERKQNIILYNPTKDVVTPQFCTLANFQHVGLKDLTRDELSKILSCCKVYIDFGSHPGRDKIPREAALCGCIVITNKTGSAGNNMDVNIDDKFKYTNDLDNLPNLINEIFTNYEEISNEQSDYKQKIYQDKVNMILSFVNLMNNIFII